MFHVCEVYTSFTIEVHKHVKTNPPYSLQVNLIQSVKFMGSTCGLDKQLIVLAQRRVIPMYVKRGPSLIL